MNLFLAVLGKKGAKYLTVEKGVLTKQSPFPRGSTHHPLNPMIRQVYYYPKKASILFYERGCQVTDCAAATVNCQPASFVEECRSLAADRLATVTSGISLELSNHLLTLRVPVR